MNKLTLLLLPLSWVVLIVTEQLWVLNGQLQYLLFVFGLPLWLALIPMAAVFVPALAAHHRRLARFLTIAMVINAILLLIYPRQTVGIDFNGAVQLPIAVLLRIAAVIAAGIICWCDWRALVKTKAQ